MSWKISEDRSTIFTRKRKNIKNKVGQTNEVVDALQVGVVDINAFKFWSSASASAEGKRVITARVSSGGLAQASPCCNDRDVAFHFPNGVQARFTSESPSHLR